MKDIDTKRPRKLDLDAPLLSTRRSYLSYTTGIELARASSLRGSSNRVPFSWEKSPGTPKDMMSRDQNGVQGRKVLPLPKPPLIRWQEDEQTLTHHNDNHNNDNDDDNGSFSDVIDLFSLAGSLNTSERLDLESDINGESGSLSPNFMIQRFLPATNALAASSLSALADNKENSNNQSSSNKTLMGVYSSNSHFKEGLCRVPRETYSSPKSCGLQIFFSWRAKHRLCGVGSPVRRVHYDVKPQLRQRNK